MSSRLAANTVDAAALADELARFRVVEPGRLTELLSEFPGGGSVALAEFLVHRGILTPFQADRALAGESRAIVLGPYRLVGTAGPGIFGPVYSATRSDKPGQFRLRLFPLRSLWRARQARQLARTLITSNQHPAIVHLLDADSANGYHYLVWPQVDGQSLADRVAARGPLPPDEVLAILSALADALHTCHVRKFVHGALTPHSIVLDQAGSPRLLEMGAGTILAFNLADEESLLDTLSAAVATAEILKYAAPEYPAESGGSPATDQYALGAIAYFALTGETPFSAPRLTDWLAAKTLGQAIPLSEMNETIPVELGEVIERMLRPSPQYRFASLDEVHGRLLEIAEVVGTASLPPQVAEPQAPASKELPAFSFLDVSIPPSRPDFGSAIGELPTRDDSDASINFELPPLVPDVFPIPRMLQSDRAPPTQDAAIPRLPEVDTPTRSIRETEPSRSQDLLRNASAPPPVSGEKRNLPPSPQRTDSPVAGPSPTSPILSKSPALPEDLPMAELYRPDSPDRSSSLAPSKPRAPLDPRKGVSTPYQYLTDKNAPESTTQPNLKNPAGVDESSGSDSELWKKVKRSLLFWQSPMDSIQVSVYGPASVAPGQSAKISVYLHTPETKDNVRTLSRAFHHDSELIGFGAVAKEVARETELGVHLSAANAGISRSLQTMSWRGQPHRIVFELHVPWESPSGPAPGLVSIGRENVRIGKIEFCLNLLPRRG